MNLDSAYDLRVEATEERERSEKMFSRKHCRYRRELDLEHRSSSCMVSLGFLLSGNVLSGQR